MGNLVAGATEISASEGEAGGEEVAGTEDISLEWVHSMSKDLLCSHDDPEKKEAEIHLETKNNPFDLLAIFPVSVQMRSGVVMLVPASPTPESQLT